MLHTQMNTQYECGLPVACRILISNSNDSAQKSLDLTFHTSHWSLITTMYAFFLFTKILLLKIRIRAKQGIEMKMLQAFTGFLFVFTLPAVMK